MINRINISKIEKEELLKEINRLKSLNQELNFKKIIHQIAPKNINLWPKAWLICQETWRKNFKDYKYILWDDETIDTFVKNNYPLFYEYIYIKFPYDIQKYDFVRYFILYCYGGIYADMDYFCVKNFSDMIDFKKISIAASEIKREKYQNALMISPPKNIFWLDVIAEIITHSDLDPNFKPDPILFSSPKTFYVVNTTGPVILEKAIDKYNQKNVNILSKDLFTLKSIQSFAFHVSTSFWVDLDSFLAEGSDDSNKYIRQGIVKDWIRRREGIFNDKKEAEYLT